MEKQALYGFVHIRLTWGLVLGMALTSCGLGCGGAAVPLETARVAACIATEEGIVASLPEGVDCTATPDHEACVEARGRVACTRAVCDELKRHVREAE